MQYLICIDYKRGEILCQQEEQFGMAAEYTLADSISFFCIIEDSRFLTMNVVTFSNAISDMQSQFQSLTSLHGRNPYVVFPDEENALLLKDCFHKLGLRLPPFLFRVHLLYQEFSLFSKRCSITYPVENSMDFVLRVCNAREPAIRGLQRCLDIQEALQSLFQKGHSLSPSTMFLLASQSTQDNIRLRSPGFSSTHSSLGHPSDLSFSLRQSTPAETLPEIGTTPSTLLSRQSDTRDGDPPQRHFSLDASASPLSRPRYARTPTLSMEIRRPLAADSRLLHEGYPHFRGTHSQTPLLHASPFRDARGVSLGEDDDEEFMPELQLSRGQESYLGSTLFTFHERPVVSASPALTSLPTRTASALGGSDTRSLSLSSTTTTTAGTSLWSEPLGSRTGESLFTPSLLGPTSHPVGQSSIDGTFSHSSTRGIFHPSSSPHTLPPPSELGLGMRVGGSVSGVGLSRGLSADSNGGGRRRSHSLSVMSSSTSTTPSIAGVGIGNGTGTGTTGGAGMNGGNTNSTAFYSTGAGVNGAMSNSMETSSASAFRYDLSSPMRYQAFTPTFPSTTRGSHGLLDTGLDYAFARGSPMSHLELDVDADLARTASGSEMSGFELSRGSVDVRLSSDFKLEDGLGTFSSSFDYSAGGGGKGSHRGGGAGSTLNPYSAEFIPGRSTMATNNNSNSNSNSNNNNGNYGNNRMTTMDSNTTNTAHSGMFSGTELTTNEIIAASASSSGMISAADSPSSPSGVVGMNEINRSSVSSSTTTTANTNTTTNGMQFVGNGYDQVDYGLHYSGVHMNSISMSMNNNNHNHNNANSTMMMNMPSASQSDQNYAYYHYYNGMLMNTANPLSTPLSSSSSIATMPSSSPHGVNGNGVAGGQSRDKRSRDLLVGITGILLLLIWTLSFMIEFISNILLIHRKKQSFFSVFRRILFLHSSYVDFPIMYIFYILILLHQLPLPLPLSFSHG